MVGAAGAAAEMLSPAEADWPPELRLPQPPPPPQSQPAIGMDDSQFLGSIMALPAQTLPHHPQATAAAAEAQAVVGVKRRRGRPPKKKDGAGTAAVVPAAAKAARGKVDEEEVVCFICFDGGNLVVCDRRGCPKVYHPACIKRDEAFFQSRSKWNCGWHICSSCEKAVHYMCYTCTYSLCKVCIKQGKFFSVRGTKGFCDTCYTTILLIESKDEGGSKVLLLEYIKQNNLRDPQRKSQIICDSRLHRLFRKTRVAHFEMLKLLEMHFLVSEPSTVNDDNQGVVNPNSAQIDHASGHNDMAAKISPDRRRRMHRKMERESQANPEDYAAIDMHNISLIYLRRSLMEDLIDDPTFSDKISGAFVRIRISGLGQKQDMYRLVKVVGTHNVSDKYSIGKKTTNLALEIMNLNKKEIITMDTVSNQDFTEEECKRLRQSMKYNLISRLKVGDIQEKAKVFQFVRVNDLINTPEERTRRINEVLDVHVDSHMDPDYESTEEFGNVERNINWSRSDTFASPIKVKHPNTSQKNYDATHHPRNLSKQNTVRKSGAARNFENSHSSIGMDVRNSGTNVKSTMCGTAPLSSSGVTVSNEEPEKVWHYKDPSGNVQGPFTLLQLSKWTSYFPRDMRVWLTFESEERSLLLTEVLSKQPKDFGQPASVTTSSKSTLADTGRNRNNQIVDLNKAPSPVGYSMLNSSETTAQSTKHSVLERESVNSLDDRLSLSTDSVPQKDTNTSNSQAMFRTKHSSSLPSPGSPHQQPDLHHDEVHGGHSGEWNNQHNSSERWSPAMPQTSSSAQSDLESYHNQVHHYALSSQVQHDSKNSLQARSGKNLNSRQDFSQKLPGQRITRDVPSPVFAWSPSESRTASSQYEGSCLSSTTNLCSHDELHSSIASAKAKSFAPATPVEDRGSSSPSGMLSHSERAPIRSPQSAPSVSASDTCKMEIINQQKTLEADISNTSVNQSPQSKILPESSPDNEDTVREYRSPPPISESKGLSPQSRTTPESSPDNQDNQDTEHEDRSPLPISESKVLYPQSRTPESSPDKEATERPPPISESKELYPQSRATPISSPDKQDTECEYPSPPPIPESKELSPQSRTIPESSPDNQDTEREYPSPPPIPENKELSPHSKVLPESSPDNKDAEPECPSPTPTPTPESKEPSPQSKILPEPSPDDQDIKHEYPSPTVICKSKEVSPQSKILSECSLDNQDIEHEYPDPTLISESKELAVDLSGSVSLAPEKIASDVGEHSSLAFMFSKSSPAGDGALKSVSDIEKTLFDDEDSNIKEELYVESTDVIRGDMVVNPASGVESIDMSENLLESLIEQSCGSFYMDGATALENFLSGSTKEEPQCSSPIALSTCSSPIALSPWGEPGYYEGDSVGSLWGIQDNDPINDIWPLSTQTPALHYSSGSTAHFIDEVTVTHGDDGIVPRSTMPGEKVELPNSGVCMDWRLVEQVNPEANDASVSTINGSTGLVNSQPSANDGSNVDTARNTNHNTNLPLKHETAVPLSTGSGEASRKQGCTTDMNVATSGEALGGTKNWNRSAGNANRGSQRNHHRDRYSQISESWLLSSNYSRGRSDGFGTGGSSRSTPRGQTQRGVCKFHENGYCRKGASCNYLHPQ
uniref:Uncharacterized protein n=1 Tax=Leersia perrieri TaxID=77586 RepID=A0A0D9VNK0_9ORYZ